MSNKTLHVVINGDVYIPLENKREDIPEAPESAPRPPPVFTAEDMLEMLPVVASDLSHNVEPARQEVNQANLAEGLYLHVIRSLHEDDVFGYREKQKGRMCLMVKGFTRDVWDYLSDAYALIHQSDLVALLNKLEAE